MTRQAEMRARDFVALVLRGVGAETEIGVVQRLLLQAQTALGSYADPEWAQGTGWPQFADRLLELARAAEPGSDHQLAFVNALAGARLAPTHTAILRSLLDGSVDAASAGPSVVTQAAASGPAAPAGPAQAGLAGLVVDTDLRWRVIYALAAAVRSTPTASRPRSSTPNSNATRPPRAAARPPPPAPPVRRPR
jgi:aminopeptidase N